MANRKLSTLFDKLWETHIVHQREDGYSLLYIDRHYVGDDLPRGTFQNLEGRGLAVRRPDLTFASPDHYAPTVNRDELAMKGTEQLEMIQELRRATTKAGIALFDLHDSRQGIVHVFGPELGLSLPGMTVVCGDSHTSTHGAFGALGIGIGASEVMHVFATQTLWQRKPKCMAIEIEGDLGRHVTAKDIILFVISRIGVAGGAGHVIEYRGSVVRSLSMEARMTLCNMSIEAGARAGLIAPDETTFAYLKGRQYAPAEADWETSVQYWSTLATDEDAVFNAVYRFDAAEVAPMVSWGTNPSETVAIDAPIPEAAESGASRQRAFENSLAYMGLEAGSSIQGLPIDKVFIGSCTNGRIEDLELAASVLQGRRVLVPTIVVPGSSKVRALAEQRGLDRVFKAAGADWREAGCSMCLAINGDVGNAGERVASTTNRNFVGRQGQGVRTHLLSPTMAAAAAVHGRLTDVRLLSVLT